MGARKSKFTYCVELLALLAVATASAQSVTPSPTCTPTPTFTWTATVNTDTPTDSPTSTPTSTHTWDPFATPTWTPTWNPFATDTPTPGSPTPTFTPTITFTFSPTGTLSPTLTFTPTLTSTPSISRASLALLPTAYSNAWDRWDGWNWNIAFSYYIGSIVSRDNAKPYLDSLQQVSLALLTSDVKYAWLDDNGDSPGMASGLLLSFLAQVGSGNSSTGTGGTQSFEVAGNTMGGVYTVMSKTIAPKTAVHLGYIYSLRDLSKSSGLGLVSMNYSQLLPFLSPDLEAVLTNQTSPPSYPSGIFYAGFSTRFWDRYWKFEIWKPFPMEQNPVLLNTVIDGLPLAFNLGYERWDSGFALLGYVNFPITLIPTNPAY